MWWYRIWYAPGSFHPIYAIEKGKQNGDKKEGSIAAYPGVSEFVPV